MWKNFIQQLSSYVDALHPIIYINHFDFVVVDNIISEVAKDTAVYEFNDANGYVDFKTKIKKGSYSLESFLSLIDIEEINAFIVLKDVHFYLNEPKIIARLKSIAYKNLNKNNFNATVFILSNKLEIPRELENFITLFEIPNPGSEDIVEIIKKYAEDLKFEISDDTISQIALSFKGLNEFEIRQILNLAYQNGGYIDQSAKHLILKEKEQIIKKSGMIEIVNFKETIDDIGGLENLKEWLNKKAKIFKQLDKALKFGVDFPKGIMIVGMPGCGKSITAKATARLFEVPLLRLDVGRLLGKYVGESEANMRKALKISEAVSPCVLWIDEIEKAFAGVGSEGGGNDVATRLFGHFLTWIQEKESTVFIVATANDISKLPPEFLRKGRFDEMFFVDLPNTEERIKIFRIHLQKRKKLSKSINTIKLGINTEGFSGADIESIVKEALENAFVNNKEGITTEDLLAVIKETKSISVTLKERTEKIKQVLSKYDIKPASKEPEPIKNDGHAQCGYGSGGDGYGLNLINSR